VCVCVCDRVAHGVSSLPQGATRILIALGSSRAAMSSAWVLIGPQATSGAFAVARTRARSPRRACPRRRASRLVRVIHGTVGIPFGNNVRLSVTLAAAAPVSAVGAAPAAPVSAVDAAPGVAPAPRSAWAHPAAPVSAVGAAPAVPAAPAASVSAVRAASRAGISTTSTGAPHRVSLTGQLPPPHVATGAAAGSMATGARSGSNGPQASGDRAKRGSLNKLRSTERCANASVCLLMPPCVCDRVRMAFLYYPEAQSGRLIFCLNRNNAPQKQLRRREPP